MPLTAPPGIFNKAALVGVIHIAFANLELLRKVVIPVVLPTFIKSLLSLGNREQSKPSSCLGRPVSTVK